MLYSDLVKGYPLTHSPGSLTKYDSLRNLIIQHGYKVLVVRRETWGSSYAIVDAVDFPSPSKLAWCCAYGNVFWFNGRTDRIKLDNVNRAGWYELLAVSDIDIIVRYFDK